MQTSSRSGLPEKRSLGLKERSKAEVVVQRGFDGRHRKILASRRVPAASLVPALDLLSAEMRDFPRAGTVLRGSPRHDLRASVEVELREQRRRRLRQQGRPRPLDPQRLAGWPCAGVFDEPEGDAAVAVADRVRFEPALGNQPAGAGRGARRGQHPRGHRRGEPAAGPPAGEQLARAVVGVLTPPVGADPQGKAGSVVPGRRGCSDGS
ncbi:hypothetical protein [Amycolatopsis sp. FDAARGOS 1241]|uniref:hypothetical protein n=1 Tax=Amycolatopsis sp. FDAARGOS 1241 TaxID=2778070 RepID=UPI00195178C9|nr:hypothetical protein [Amycolatopsis sp. FDAARGOS 1241]QRP51380.1 hypothetical protein I6J71_21930 [Amycolatopsis sp. FDAARGOS 1241]